jgi:hypothetical protein
MKPSSFPNNRRGLVSPVGFLLSFFFLFRLPPRHDDGLTVTQSCHVHPFFAGSHSRIQQLTHHKQPSLLHLWWWYGMVVTQVFLHVAGGPRPVAIPLSTCCAPRTQKHITHVFLFRSPSILVLEAALKQHCTSVFVFLILHAIRFPQSHINTSEQ